MKIGSAPKNPCSRCGTERILVRSWTEAVETFSGSVDVEYAENICPDPECQKIVAAEILAAEEKKEKLRKDKEKRALENKNKHFGRKPKSKVN